MSDVQPALGGAEFDGAGARVVEMPPKGMITLRGSPDEIGAAVADATGCAVPGQREITFEGEFALGWMSPDEFLLMCPRDEVGTCLKSLGETLAGSHHLAVDVSDARAVFSIAGPGAREVLARLCPVDLASTAFGPGEIRRSRIAQVPAAFWIDANDDIKLICFRSVARYAFDVLCGAAKGEPVGVLR
ncbi:sarcosine oxidase subunit gamma [Tropicimonas marinistellae]|uniref:sarcosine oxidase subunit gamma n=1 Tax=Tropicimonas marinistellae TaxID=1739787 RepID=UPI00082E7EBF|nr:sarcosine oxidase subunit gamma family protein [Tropicimonas marinistellae]